MAFWKSAKDIKWIISMQKMETGVNEPTTAASLCLACQEEFMPRWRENN